MKNNINSEPLGYSISEPLGYLIKEACRLSSLGRTSIYANIAAGRLKAIHVGRRTIISAASLHTLLAGKG